MTLEARYYYNTCYNSAGQPYSCRSSWNSWGRWVALGAILLFAFLFFFVCSCFSARRRRRAGRNPYYGTGWTGRGPLGHGTAQYNPNYQTQQQQQPNLSQPAGGYYGANQGYYQGRQTDTEMQPPANTYRAGDQVYEPPTGPPPAKA